MPKNRESSLPNSDEPGEVKEIKNPFPSEIGTEHPKLLDLRREHRLKKAIQKAEEIAPDLKIADEADASDLSSRDLGLVDRVSEEVDRIAGSEGNPQKK